MKKIFILILLFLSCISFLIFFNSTKTSKELIKVGVTAGPHAKIMHYIKEKKHVPIEIIEFNDFILPNLALSDGSIDVNCYQHARFMESQNKERGLKLINVFPTILLPIGIYSKKIKNINDIKEGGVVAIPNDPTNGVRALLLLEKAELIKLDHSNISIHYIVENHKKLQIKEFEAPMIPRSLDDFDMAVINTDWVIASNIEKNLQIFKEDKDSPYTNILVAREETLDKANVIKEAYMSDEVKKFINETFKGDIIPAW